MNNPDFEQPALTAFALGELGPAEAASVRRLIATSPEVRAEYERIAQTVAAMRNAPALPRRTLTQRQRETVLAMGQAPSRGPKVVPFAKPPVRRPDAAWGFVKYAAAACLTIGAFALGQRFTPHGDVNVAAHDPLPSAPSQPVAAPAPASQVAVASASAPLTQPDIKLSRWEAVSFEPVLQPPGIAPVLLAETPPASPAPAVAAEAPKAITPAVVTSRPTVPAANALKSFTVAVTQAESSIPLRPQLMRVVPKPVPREFAGQVLAAPIQEKPKTAPKNAAPRKPDPQPPLVIHSWKAEIASCPWDSSRRLMRLVAQIPVDQDGVETNKRDYELMVKFDPAQVQAWRLITEKHMPPSNGGLLATRFVWYEIVPGRNFAPKADKPAVLGVLDIIQPRGTARDSQPLKLLDRGLTWNEAREDFVFETAMVGFNLLLQGRENIGNLNHKLVLELAEQSRDDDPKGERGKFITVVKQAQKAAGL
jgi:hypothetical protein